MSTFFTIKLTSGLSDINIFRQNIFLRVVDKKNYEMACKLLSVLRQQKFVAALSTQQENFFGEMQ
jgi:hypothetical protein